MKALIYVEGSFYFLLPGTAISRESISRYFQWWSNKRPVKIYTAQPRYYVSDAPTIT
jgi:hypothetical protein